MKRFLWPVVLLFALLLITAVWRQCRNEGNPGFQTTIVTRGALTQAVTTTGTLNPVLNVQVGTQISGNILELFEVVSQSSVGRIIGIGVGLVTSEVLARVAQWPTLISFGSIAIASFRILSRATRSD